jgi:hypothetical protein
MPTTMFWLGAREALNLPGKSSSKQISLIFILAIFWFGLEKLS